MREEGHPPMPPPADARFYAHETPQYRQKLAYELHHHEQLPLSVVADMFDVGREEVKEWIEEYIAVTDARTADEQHPLFDT